MDNVCKLRSLPCRQRWVMKYEYNNEESVKKEFKSLLRIVCDFEINCNAKEKKQKLYSSKKLQGIFLAVLKFWRKELALFYSIHCAPNW